MKRTPCALAISPSSCGSMMTKRDLSWAKCRSISGNVPLPIEPKPIMTMGPEILARICAADGLIKFVSEKWGCVWREQEGSSAAPFRRDFDLDLHLGLQQSGDHKERCGRPDIAEIFAADREYRVGVPAVADVIGCADDVGEGESAVLERRLDAFETVSRLVADIRRQGHGGVVVSGGAGDECESAIDYGAAVAGAVLERRTGG